MRKKTCFGRRKSESKSLRLNHVWLRYYYPHFIGKWPRIMEVSNLSKPLQVENGRFNPHLKTASELLPLGLITFPGGCCVSEGEIYRLWLTGGTCYPSRFYKLKSINCLKTCLDRLKVDRFVMAYGHQGSFQWMCVSSGNGTVSIHFSFAVLSVCSPGSRKYALLFDTIKALFQLSIDGSHEWGMCINNSSGTWKPSVLQMLYIYYLESTQQPCATGIYYTILLSEKGELWEITCQVHSVCKW